MMFPSHLKMANNCKTRKLLIFLLYTLKVCAFDGKTGKEQYIEDKLTGQYREDQLTGQYRENQLTGQYRENQLTGQYRENQLTGQYRENQLTGQYREDQLTGQYRENQFTGQYRENQLTGQYREDQLTGQYREDQLINDIYGQNFLSTAQNENMLIYLVKTILKEKTLENLSGNIMSEINLQIKTLKETVESQNIFIDQLAKRMTEKENVIKDLNKRLKLHEESHAKMPVKIQADQHKEETNADTNNELETMNDENKENTSSEYLTEKNSSKRNNNEFSVKQSQLPGFQAASITKVAFSVFLSHEVSKEKNLDRFIIKFDGIILNEEEMYNKHTGAFTAPISGIYHFNFHCSASDDGLIYPTLMKNDKRVVSSCLNPQHFTLNGGNTVMMSLNKGDSVWVQIFASTPTGIQLKGDSSSSTTTFSGFLLYQQQHPHK